MEFRKYVEWHWGRGYIYLYKFVSNIISTTVCIRISWLRPVNRLWKKCVTNVWRVTLFKKNPQPPVEMELKYPDNVLTLSMNIKRGIIIRKPLQPTYFLWPENDIPSVITFIFSRSLFVAKTFSKKIREDLKWNYFVTVTFREGECITGCSLVRNTFEAVYKKYTIAISIYTVTTINMWREIKSCGNWTVQVIILLPSRGHICLLFATPQN